MSCKKLTAFICSLSILFGTTGISAFADDNYADLENRRNEVSQQLYEINKKIDDKNLEIKNLKSKSSEIDNQIKKIKRKNKTAENDISKISKSIEKDQNKINDTHKNITDNINSTICSLVKDKETKLNKITELPELLELKNNYEKNAEQHKNKKEKIEAKQDEYDETIGELEQKKDNIKNKIKKIEKDKDKDFKRRLKAIHKFDDIMNEYKKIWNTNLRVSSDMVGEYKTDNEKINTVMNMARSMIGGRYVWGAAAPQAADCSGLALLCYSKIGINLPHLASAQAQYGTSVPLTNVKPGDMVFFGGNTLDSIYHVGLYAGNGMLIHAEGKNTGIVISSLSSVASSNHITCIKRLI